MGIKFSSTAPLTYLAVSAASLAYYVYTLNFEVFRTTQLSLFLFMPFIIDFINAKGGALGKKFELVPFDNKSQPSDALIALKSATDQNMPFIMQWSIGS